MATEHVSDNTASTLRDSDENDPDQLPDDENAPLLTESERVEADHHDDYSRPDSSAVSSLLRCIRNPKASRGSCLRRWPSILALALLCVVALVILVLGFVAPQVAKEYAQQAATFEPTSLSIDSYTNTGVVARVQGLFTMNPAQVHKKSVRNLGRFGAWVARSVEIGATEVEVGLPRHDGIVLGTASVPSFTLSLLSDWYTPIDTLVNLEPGPRDGLRQIAKEWVDGQFDDYVAEARAEVPIRSGILHLGRQHISQVITLPDDQIPTIPSYKIKRLNFHDMEEVSANHGITADISVVVDNKYPVDITVPSLGFSVGVDNCLPSDPHIKIAEATTQLLHVKPDTNVMVNVTGFVRQLPESFLTACPGSLDSPFDTLLGNYIQGKDATVYVSGSDSPSQDTPQWITDLAYGVTVPISFPGRSLGNLIKNFSMTDVHFSLPDFFADPDTPEAQPKISAQVKALIALPDEMNFHVDVNRIRSTADVFYHKKKLGELDISRWHDATSKEVKEPGESHPDLLVTSNIEKAPLKITDDDVFNDLVRGLLAGRDTINLTVKALVDVEMDTPLGTLAVRQIPAEGGVPVKPIGGSKFESFAPKFNDLRIVNTSTQSLFLRAAVNFTNPTSYTAEIPYADVNILVNGTIIGHGTVRDASIKKGNNTNVLVEAVWEPLRHNATSGPVVGRELLSQYLSGYNTTLAFRPHTGTIPAQPYLGKALETLQIEIPTPRLGGHGDEGADDQPHFIKEATMHLVTSTANFVLSSPLLHTTIDLTHINATAYYHGDAVGRILYDGDIEIPPGDSETPRLPVDWSLGSVGYEAIKNALGGTLKLQAFAYVSLRIGRYEDKVWYRGRSIGAKVRL